jgi:peptidoglycan/xylan/chitin deacetylase (PgdA/CDA1 family)
VSLIRRASNGWRRFAIEHFARRNFRLSANVPYVSFTFDDFPRTALTEGGRILREHGVRGTYFVSFQLLDTDTVSGRVASLPDLESVLHDGHELGCHTFNHVDGSVVSAAEFERSIEANRFALATSGLDAHFETFAYPLNGPAVPTKKVAGARFTGCRGGGQTFNHDVVDLSLLKAYFLDGRSRDRLSEIRELIERNAAARGWLIFATHDVCTGPSDYGYTPDDFSRIVDLSQRSGARVLTMSQVCQQLGVLPDQEKVDAHNLNPN